MPRWIADAEGNLFGVTYTGGAFTDGTVYVLDSGEVDWGGRERRGVTSPPLPLPLVTSTQESA